MTIIWPSPAKLNLFLYITGRQYDGYHRLQTLFQFLEYGDRLKIIPDNSGIIKLLTPVVEVPLQKNLILHAAQALKQIAITRKILSVQAGAKISINKVLPIGGGLGGGSSNAATVLIALNYLWGTSLNEHELISIGYQLGYDIPIFIRGRNLFVNGTKIQQVELMEKWYLVLYPGININTHNIFHDPELTRNSPIRSLDELLQLPFHNDCELIVRKRFPEVNKLLLWLLKFVPARLTGTGSCVFCQFNSEAEAHQILDLCPKWITGFVTRGVNHSPLQQVVSKL
ncbi:4-(cytidine 5'-diphospho)-2-C-methyl-D-erythritol kinase [Pantoea sp. Mhis]|uniref:4-(cytidine 5'-diphospho)-2-C-methyl-D-erythritol kinase n=1 Tax=Pantoea sp. Mhis TaxID=2576759 RepID=UPI00135AB176|nr:4-(cytidine 5'-diphospho)-2-C-methyl-D-erythritol kinase [Pantoea sp. Mhis]MXP56170.1 4-(cytidine 5'-diphospho)-2-C-methyl-D-erythritol kinase [Pantoea sp. Mhis]